MKEPIDFRLAEISDIPQLVDLMNREYLRKKRESYFLWQYFHSSYPTILMGAFFGAKLMGMFGLQKRKLQNGLNVGQAIDLLIASEWRKKGLFLKLGEKAFQCFENLDLLCVLPNLAGKNACEKSLKWKTLGKIHSMSLLSENLINIKDEKSIFSENVDRKNTFSMFYYDERIRNWRYDQHPEYHYDYIFLDSGEFAVTKIFIDPVEKWKSGDIVDIKCALNDKKLLKELLIKAIYYLKKQNMEIITTWALPHTALHQVLESLGFSETPQERYFCMKVLKRQFEYLYDINRWHLVQADAEIY